MICAIFIRHPSLLTDHKKIAFKSIEKQQNGKFLVKTENTPRGNLPKFRYNVLINYPTIIFVIIEISYEFTVNLYSVCSQFLRENFTKSCKINLSIENYTIYHRYPLLSNTPYCSPIKTK